MGQSVAFPSRDRIATPEYAYDEGNCAPTAQTDFPQHTGSHAAIQQCTFGMWPGLEKQLELSFASLDCKGEGLVWYESLEPVLRHHLLQMGLMELVARLVDDDGKLNSEEIAGYLEEYHLDITREFDLQEWKLLVLCWIRRCGDLQDSDTQKWQDTVHELQHKQAEKYQQAMHQFQELYIRQLEGYYRSVETAHRQEEEYRHEWETSLNVQEEFYQTQMAFLQSRNQEAMDLYRQQMESGSDTAASLLRHLDLGRESVGELAKVKFAYPATVTATGAPVSAGAQLPQRRRYRR